MKLNFIALSSIFFAAMCASCSAVYEALDPCPQGANVRLTFCNNLSGDDKFDEQVHCAKVLLYDEAGEFVSAHDLNGSTTSVALEPGKYHAIAYGGMSCEESDFEFSHDLNAPHNYNDLQSWLKGTRAPESTKKLHDHFHGMGDFTISEDDMDFISTSIDLTKNTNSFRIELVYSDGSPIKASAFDYTITADNAVADHKNSVVEQGEEVTYRPHAEGETEEANGINVAWADLSVAHLMGNSKARLSVTNSAKESVVNLKLIEYLDKIRQLDAGNIGLQSYLDRQDSWTLRFTLDPEKDLLISLTIKINNWSVIINDFDL